MTIDKPEHQKLLLELINAATYPGHIIELACELRRAVLEAEVADSEQDA